MAHVPGPCWRSGRLKSVISVRPQTWHSFLSSGEEFDRNPEAGGFRDKNGISTHARRDVQFLQRLP